MIDIFLLALEPSNLLILFAATVAGVIIGAIPGLTVTMAIALAVPLTLWMETMPSMMLLIGLYGSGIFGGSISACLMNAPGTPASAATAIDGYRMTQKGLAVRALRIALIASTYGGAFSVVLLIFIAPKLASIALKFGPTELAALLLFALTVIGVLSGGSMLKGLLAASLGMVLATIGADPMLTVPRFTFGSYALFDGLSYIPLLIGLFAITEILEQAQTAFRSDQQIADISGTEKEKNRIRFADIRRIAMPSIQSGFVGAFIGMLPGLGAAIASFLGYAVAKRTSRRPEEFGEGSIEGIASSESANNAVTGSAMIPMLALGIPGDPPTAILLGALMIQGITAGPMVFVTNPEAVLTIYVVMILALIVLAVVAWSGMRGFASVIRIPKIYLFPAILCMCVAGSFAIRSSVFDVYVMFAAGGLGLLMRRFDVPIPPLLVAFILTPPFERALRQSLTMSRGDVWVFFEHPISVVFIVLSILVIAGTIWDHARRKPEHGSTIKKGLG